MSRRDRSKDAPKSAAELMAELRADPEFVAKQRAQEQARRENVERYRAAAQPVVDELRSLGFDVHAIGELRRTGRPYPEAVPSLIRWLPKVEDSAVKEDIVRSLSVPWATEAASTLVAEFERVDDGVRWAIGNALDVVADDCVFEGVRQIALDRTCGRTREMVVVALGNMSKERALPVLLQLLRDDQVAGHAVMGLGRLADPAAASDIEPFLEHPKPWIRTEAKKALARMGNAKH